MSVPAVQKIRTLLVDDQALFRESLARVLRADPEFEIQACGTIRDALTIVSQTPIDLVLLDLDLGGERALQFLPEAMEAGFTGRVLIVTASIHHAEARRLLRQGIAGIFIKDSSLDQLAEGIHTVIAGETWVDSRFSESVSSPDGQTEIATRPKFNEKQKQVLKSVVEGLGNKEIAWRLQISESYVKAILQRLFQKTGVRTRGQLVRVALEQYDEQLR